MKKNFKRAIALVLTAIMIIGSSAVIEAADVTDAPQIIEEEIGGVVRREIKRSFVDEVGSEIEAIEVVGGGETEVGATTTVTTRDAFVKEIRKNLVARTSNFTIQHNFPTSGTYDFNFFSNAFNEARKEHTGNGTEGDYLLTQVASASFVFYPMANAAFQVSANYKSSASQESQVTSKINTTLTSLNLGSKTEVAKIKAIHDFVVGNATYGSGNGDLRYTAYGNLIQKQSVCQGYALVMYRMLLQAGIDNRIVTGNYQGRGHAWNIVKVGTKYYHLDATFDDNLSNTQYYLRGTTFTTNDGYVANSDFKQTSFTSKYPQSTTDYQAAATNLSKATVTTKSASYAYTGAARKPAPIVTLNGKTLVVNTDYTVTFSNNINVGTAKMTIKGKGSYTGTAYGTFKITAASISGATVKTTSASYTYTGAARRPKPTVTLSNGKQLVVNTDCTVAFKNNTNVGTATITVTGIGNYKGTATGTFKITAASLSGATVKTKSASYAYTGSARKPAPIVTLNGKTLVVSTDYTVTYKNNTNKGTATVTVKGKGNYKGTASGTFKIT
ncbi:MAG: transglutaminase-like domain-containing protein [Lachnospiraceae bacterium]|nr:transglutaminase-like domain-containing protein [Lachnospiraceae bacterium]